VNIQLDTDKIRIERRAHQRVQLDAHALYQYRLKRLNTQAVQRWRTV
jgi:hypothetical protein